MAIQVAVAAVGYVSTDLVSPRHRRRRRRRRLSLYSYSTTLCSRVGDESTSKCGFKGLFQCEVRVCF